MWALQQFRAARSTHLDVDLGPSALESALELLLDFEAVAFSTLVLAIVITNFRQQKELFQYWRDDNHWARK